MKIETRAVHTGDRKKSPSAVGVTTPIHTATSFFYERMEDLDRIFAREAEGYCYGRYDNPTNNGLEELLTGLEGGAGALGCGSGMAGVHMAILAALADRRKTIVAAEALYGASVSLLMTVLEPLGIETRFVDSCDEAALEKAIAEVKPGCVLLESISNPVLRVSDIERICQLTKAVGGAVVVDNTFATPLLIRPLELGANFVVHSLTKYLAGHGDVLGGAIICDRDHLETVRSYSRIFGPVLGPFESYLAMRGIKTFPLRMRRQCENAAAVARWLRTRPEVERVNYLDDPAHPDASVIARLLRDGLYGAMVSFELRGAGREEVFRFMDGLKMVVRATSLGDVHSMMLYPVMSSHREVSPKHRQRMGVRDNLVRLSVGIEDPGDIIEDLESAFASLKA